jgi:hypothetical protein
MEKIIKISYALCLFIVITSFSWTSYNVKEGINPKGTQSGIMNTNDEIIITHNKSDVCGLKKLGEVTVIEKRWFYCNNDLKEKTLAELKKLASEKGGNIIFVDITKSKGFGIFFSTTITGYVFKK